MNASIDNLNLDRVCVVIPELKLPPWSHFSTMMSAAMQHDVVMGRILEVLGVLVIEIILFGDKVQ